jgi:hypothetical protein
MFNTLLIIDSPKRVNKVYVVGTTLKEVYLNFYYGPKANCFRRFLSGQGAILFEQTSPINEHEQYISNRPLATSLNYATI